jgi:hypothetical protein
MVQPPLICSCAIYAEHVKIKVFSAVPFTFHHERYELVSCFNNRLETNYHSLAATALNYVGELQEALPCTQALVSTNKTKEQK